MGDEKSKNQLPVPVSAGTKLGNIISQTDNQVGGHLSGRDILDANRDINQVNIDTVVVTPFPQSISHLGKLYKRLADEAEGDKVLTDYIRQLKIYTRIVQDEKVIGLEGKFSAAGREDELEMAMEMKECVFAEIRENLFSITYQKIAATLMGKICENFNTNVKPLIELNSSKLSIDKAVSELVVSPIVKELEECPDFIDAPHPLVRGMLYFLTGNCHIRWH